MAFGIGKNNNKDKVTLKDKIGDKIARKAFDQMAAALEQEVYNRIAKRVTEESDKQRKLADQQMCSKLDGWDVEIRKTIKELIGEELSKHIDQKVRSLVKPDCLVV